MTAWRCSPKQPKEADLRFSSRRSSLVVPGMGNLCPLVISNHRFRSSIVIVLVLVLDFCFCLLYDVSPLQIARHTGELLFDRGRFIFEVERCWSRGSGFDPVPQAPVDDRFDRF
jgi:hypothetical protein